MSNLVARPGWFATLLTYAVIYSGIGYVAAAYFASRRMTRGNGERPQATPLDQGLPCETIHCVTGDGHRLAGWLVEPASPRATILLLHGMHRNRDQHLERIGFLYEAGYRCLAFDLRAHGESTGNLISFGYHEAEDVAAILELAKARWPEQPLAALGISMGAAALCYGVERMRQLDAVILECLYRDIASTFARRLDAAFFPPSYRKLARGVIRMTEWRMGVRKEKLAPIEHVSRFTPIPVFVLTGSEDRYAPPEDTHELYEELGEPREKWIVPGAGHGDLCEVGEAAYRQKVLAFLDRWTAQSQAAANTSLEVPLS